MFRFHYIWLLLTLLLVAGIITKGGTTYGLSVYLCGNHVHITIIGIVLFFIILFLLKKPMNAVYGLMGTSGSITRFFANFIIISLLFSFTYYFSFFSKAGISYDINQTHIDYTFYENEKEPSSGSSTIRFIIIRDTSFSYQPQLNPPKLDTTINISTQRIYYQPIGFWYVFRNTVLTSLMQEPTDFFSIASTYNAGMEEEEIVNDLQDVRINGQKNKDNEKKSLSNVQKAEIFHSILILQILISWIFFGVFISLLYSKFRYES